MNVVVLGEVCVKERERFQGAGSVRRRSGLEVGVQVGACRFKAEMAHKHKCRKILAHQKSAELTRTGYEGKSTLHLAQLFTR